MDIISAIGLFDKPLKYLPIFPFCNKHNSKYFYTSNFRRNIFSLIAIANLIYLTHYTITYFQYFKHDTKLVESYGQTKEISTFVENCIGSFAFMLIRLSSLWYCKDTIKILNSIIDVDRKLNSMMNTNYSKLRNSLRFLGLIHLAIYTHLCIAEFITQFKLHMYQSFMDYFTVLYFKCQVIWTIFDGLIAFGVIMMVYVEAIHLNKFIESGGWDSRVEIISIFKKFEVIVDGLSDSFYYLPLGLTLMIVSTGISSNYRLFWMFIISPLTWDELVMNYSLLDLSWCAIYITNICHVIYASSALTGEVNENKTKNIF